jgi:hypothetical protein
MPPKEHLYPMLGQSIQKQALLTNEPATQNQQMIQSNQTIQSNTQIPVSTYPYPQDFPPTNSQSNNQSQSNVPQFQYIHPSEQVYSIYPQQHQQYQQQQPLMIAPPSFSAPVTPMNHTSFNYPPSNYIPLDIGFPPSQDCLLLEQRTIITNLHVDIKIIEQGIPIHQIRIEIYDSNTHLDYLLLIPFTELITTLNIDPQLFHPYQRIQLAKKLLSYCKFVQR